MFKWENKPQWKMFGKIKCAYWVMQNKIYTEIPNEDDFVTGGWKYEAS